MDLQHTSTCVTEQSVTPQHRQYMTHDTVCGRREDYLQHKTAYLLPMLRSIHPNSIDSDVNVSVPTL